MYVDGCSKIMNYTRNHHETTLFSLNYNYIHTYEQFRVATFSQHSSLSNSKQTVHERHHTTGGAEQAQRHLHLGEELIHSDTARNIGTCRAKLAVTGQGIIALGEVFVTVLCTEHRLHTGLRPWHHHAIVGKVTGHDSAEDFLGNFTFAEARRLNVIKRALRHTVELGRVQLARALRT